MVQQNKEMLVNAYISRQAILNSVHCAQKKIGHLTFWSFFFKRFVDICECVDFSAFKKFKSAVIFFLNTMSR